MIEVWYLWLFSLWNTGICRYKGCSILWSFEKSIFAFFIFLFLFHFIFVFVLFCFVLSCLVLSYLVLSCLVLSCLVFSCLVSSCLGLVWFSSKNAYNCEVSCVMRRIFAEVIILNGFKWVKPYTELLKFRSKRWVQRYVTLSWTN